MVDGLGLKHHRLGMDASRIVVCGGELVTGQVRSAALQPLVEALGSWCEDDV